MGPPGGGKGTQAEHLAQKIHYDRFSTGSAFRAVAAQDTPLGKRVKETIENGFLAPPSMAAEIVTTAIADTVKRNKGIIFDGTPRTLEESKIVDEFFKKNGYGDPLVLLLDVDKNEMMRRISIRRFCLGVPTEFAVQTQDDEKRCLSLGGKLGTRTDDETPEKQETRWQEFQNQTQPAVERFKEQGNVHTFDGMQSIEDVHQAIINYIESTYDTP